MSARYTPRTYVSVKNGLEQHTRHRAPKAGTAVKVTFGGFPVDAVVVREMITGKYVVDMAVPGVDEPVQGLFALDEMQPAGDTARK